MRRKSLPTDRSSVDKEGGEATANNQLNKEVILGNILWVRLRPSSWWPAQIVAEKAVNGGNKPSTRLAGVVLVRLYGSNKYIYVDPKKYRSEFENILKQHNGSFSEVLKRSLELDLSRLRSGISKGEGSKSQAKTKVDASLDKTSKHIVLEKCHETTGALAEHPFATSLENGSRNGASKQRNVRKIDNPTPVRNSPRKQPAASPQQTMTKNGSLRPEESANGKNKKRKQDGLHKNLEPNSPIPVRISPRRLSSVTKPQTEVKDTILLPHKPEAKGKNGHLISTKPEAAKGKSAKKDLVEEKGTPINTSAATTPVGKSQELSARRIKVMQTLGLRAPSGSPFLQN